MVIIELVDKIIKIPATKRVLVRHDNNAETFIIRIPRTLFTDDINNTTIFLLAKTNSGNLIIKPLEYLSEDDEYVEYKWEVTREYTSEEGKLTIQIKIVRDIDEIIKDDNNEEENIETEDNITEEIDPDMMVSTGANSNGEWYSYQNSFLITNVLQPLL